VDHRGEKPEDGQGLGARARSIADSNLYLTLATADAGERPWASPVWFAHEGYRDFLWVSRPEARHARNIKIRPEVALVVFDSTAAPGDAAVYAEGCGEELAGDEVERAIRTYSRRSEATVLAALGLAALGAADVTAPARHRLYRATASRHFLLGGDHERIEAIP